MRPTAGGLMSLDGLTASSGQLEDLGVKIIKEGEDANTTD